MPTSERAAPDRPDPGRPDPDRLLQRVRAQEAKEARARLKIYLGFAPGVGKTYRMLQAARDLVAEHHVDLVIGVVEAHKRYETAALVIGLELLARRKLSHRGIELEEFDLDAALARHPDVVVVDELAHTNAPGSRHAKRWQDVIELLDAGIEVHTTVNIQHVESLNDVVAQITGVRVRETIPDAVLERADEIELIDVSPEQLRARLADGKIYLGSQAARASEAFFTQGNLLALRELALRQVAHYVDKDVVAFRDHHGVDATWGVGERILACITPAPASTNLIRAAKRMATGLRCPWSVAYVDSPALRPLSDAARERLEAHYTLAESMGATSVRLAGADIVAAVMAHARATNTTRVLVGKPQPRRWREALRHVVRGSLAGAMIQATGDIDIHVVASPARGKGSSHLREESAEPISQEHSAERASRSWSAYAWSLAMVGGITALAMLIRELIPIPDLEMLYFVGVLVAAITWGRGPAVATAIAGIAAYDFCFVPPYYTFAVADGRYALTFLLMFAIGLIVSELAARLRRQEALAITREARTAALYATNRELGEAANEAQAATVVANAIHSALGGPCHIVAAGRTGIADTVAVVPRHAALSAKDRAVADWSAKHDQAAGIGTNTLHGAEVFAVPIGTAAPTHVLLIHPEARRPPTREQRELLDAIAHQAAIAFDRLRLGQQAQEAAIAANTESMRSTLLSAVSHDLRTPLAVITGAATTLRDGITQPSHAGVGSDAAARSPGAELQRELLETICDQAERMDRLIANLLHMTSLEAGGLRPRLEWAPLEESIGAALSQLEAKLSHHTVSVDLAPDLPFVAADPVLLAQVFVNLLENAAKYAPPGSLVEIAAMRDHDSIAVEVRDRGPGLLDPLAIFGKFVRGAHADIAGAGLGLAICRGILQIHGGAITADNRDGGGAIFRFTLPYAAPPVGVSLEPAATAVSS